MPPSPLNPVPDRPDARHSQATLARCSFSIASGASYEIFHVKILKYMAVRHVTEQGDLVFETLIERMLGTADDDIRLDTHSLQLFDAGLGRLCLQFAGCL